MSIERNENLLFDQPLAHVDDPVSSYRSGERAVHTQKYRNLMQIVLQTVRLHPGMTSAEIAVILHIDRHDSGRRLPNLMHRGLVVQGRPKFCQVCHSVCVSWWPVSCLNREYWEF